RLVLASASLVVLIDDGVDWLLLASIPSQHEEAFVRSGQQRTIRSLLQGKHVTPAEARDLLHPVLSAIARGEHSAEFAIVDHSDINGFRIVPIRHHRAYVAMRISV